MALTEKQEKFCNAYIETLNASEAYRQAYECENMKPESINVKAHEVFHNVNVTLRIEELKSALQKRSDITKDAILNELSSIVFADIRDYVIFDNEELKFKSFSQLTDRQAKAIESIKQTKDGFELKLHGKNWSIEKVCKMLGFDSPTVINANVNTVDIASLPTEELLKRSALLNKLDDKA